MAKRVSKPAAVKKPAVKSNYEPSVNNLDFKKHYNYQYCYLVGKFRIYLYDNEHYQKIDANRYQLDCGKVDASTELFNDFKKNFPWQSMDREIGIEVERIGVKVTEAFQKALANYPDAWFRITFDEPKYIQGDRNQKTK